MDEKIEKASKVVENKNMNKSFKTIYKMLSALDSMLDLQKPDLEHFTAEWLKISQERFDAYLLMLQNAGYVDGVIAAQWAGGRDINIENIAITLKGLEYLAENSLMIRAYKAARGVVDLAK